MVSHPQKLVIWVVWVWFCTSVLTESITLHIQLYVCSYRQHHASCSVAPLRTDTEMLLDIRCVKSGDTKLFSWCIVFGNYAIFSVDKNVKKQPNCELCKNNKCRTGAALHCFLRSSVQVMCWCSCQLASQKITSCCFGIRGFTWFPAGTDIFVVHLVQNRLSSRWLSVNIHIKICHSWNSNLL